MFSINFPLDLHTYHYVNDDEVALKFQPLLLSFLSEGLFEPLDRQIPLLSQRIKIEAATPSAVKGNKYVVH